MAVPPAIRGMIIGMCRGGSISKAQIARDCGVNVCTVFRLWKQYQEDPNHNIPVKKHNPGRPERAQEGDNAPAPILPSPGGLVHPIHE